MAIETQFLAIFDPHSSIVESVLRLSPIRYEQVNLKCKSEKKHAICHKPNQNSGADPGFLVRGVHMHKGKGFALLILSHLS